MIGESPQPRRVLRLAELADAFVTESPEFLDNVPRSQMAARSQIAILRAVIGDARDVATISRDDVKVYAARRMAGGIQYGPCKVTRPVRQRAVQADIKLLKQMLYWACTKTMADGAPWLAHTPLRHVRVTGEQDVRRPVASFDRYEATRMAMRGFEARYAEEARSATREGGRVRAEARRAAWIRAELGLWLLESTGRRRGAIMGLRWTDFDFTGQRITWRAEYDKKRKKSVVPYPAAFFETARDFQRRLGTVGGCLFPRGDESDRPAPAELLSQWIRKAEAAAGLPKLEGGTCHPYRRKWRSERSHLPVKAVAVAGGWSDLDTMFRCYDHPDDGDVLVVTAEPRKRRESVPV
jgi:integrase